MYILIDGERRLRAMKLLGRTSIEASVRRPSRDGQARLLLAMIGNLQRSDMGPIDEGTAYRKLRESGMTIDEIAQRVGRSMSHVYNRVKALEMPGSVQELINQGRLPMDEATMGAMRRLNPGQLEHLAQIAAERSMSARQVQSAAKRIQRANGQAVPPGKPVRVVHSDSVCPALDYNPGLSKNWSWMRAAAKRVCADCGLYEGGGKQTICRECPLTLFIGRIAVPKKDEEESHE